MNYICFDGVRIPAYLHKVIYKNNKNYKYIKGIDFCNKRKQELAHRHDGAEQESLSKQESFMQMEITFTLRKNGSYMPSSLNVRLFSVDRQVGKQKFHCVTKF